MDKRTLTILGFLGVLALVVILVLVIRNNTQDYPPDNPPLNLICPTYPCPQSLVCNTETGQCINPPPHKCPTYPCSSPLVCDIETGQCINPPPHKCPTYPCSLPLICDTKTGQCINPPKSVCQGGIDLSTEQPVNTVQIINNTTEVPFHVFLEYANFNQAGGHPTLSPPTAPWTILSSSPGVILGLPINYYPSDNPPPGTKPPYKTPNAIGSATWQELTMPTQGGSVILSIPVFMPGQPWSIRPLKYHDDTTPCGGSEDDCGMPILIESGKEMVGDMSAVDGVNFLLCYEFTTKDEKTSIMNYKTNPCRASGKNPKGCTNPSIDGIFDPALVGTTKCIPPGSQHCWLSDPCPAGTCNLIGTSKAWCDAIHDGQCANSSSHWSDQQRGTGGPPSCSDHNLFTTYCYSHDDATSSPYFSSPYKIKLTYSDLI